MKRNLYKTWPERLIVHALREYSFVLDAEKHDVTLISTLYDRYVEQYQSKDWPAWNRWDLMHDYEQDWMPMLGPAKFGIALRFVWSEAQYPAYNCRYRVNGVQQRALRWCKGPGSFVAEVKPSKYDWSQIPVSE
jgi:hypothetical protein